MDEELDALDDGLLTLFWGAEVSPGSNIPFVPPPQDARLRLTQATLSFNADKGSKAALMVTVNGGPMLQVCVLREGQQENAHLDMLFDHYAEFSVQGQGTIHIIGYLCPSEEEGPGEGNPLEQMLAMQQMGLLQGGEQDDDDQDFDEDDDEEDIDSDEIDSDDLDSEDGEGEADEEDEDTTDMWEVGQRNKQPSHTIIEEIVDVSTAIQGPKAAQKPAKGAQQQQGKKRAAENAPEPQTKAAKQGKGENGKPAKSPVNGVAKEGGPKGAERANKREKHQPKQLAPQQDDDAKGKKKNKVRKFDNGFVIEELGQGAPEGKLAKAGSKVSVQYTGRLASNNKVFDKTKGKPFTFRLGIGEVVKGFDRGIEGMRVGDKRSLTIPPQMGYGSNGVRGTIPPNATLKFDVELVDVKKS